MHKSKRRPGKTVATRKPKDIHRDMQPHIQKKAFAEQINNTYHRFSCSLQSTAVIEQESLGSSNDCHMQLAVADDFSHVTGALATTTSQSPSHYDTRRCVC
mmetsp:Transcript_3334/g.5672  ORF Transcript_3334/g.5672 Transcript_3334/m.5672 type:complete len:101 (-) Transcript_3334:575-877(-)